MFRPQISNELLQSLKSMFYCVDCEVEGLEKTLENQSNDKNLKVVIDYYKNLCKEINIMYELIRMLNDI